MKKLIEATTDDALAHTKSMDFIRGRGFLVGDLRAFFFVVK